MLSDSLELYDFLLQHAVDKSIVDPAIDLLDAFTEKWRDGTFRLLTQEHVDRVELEKAIMLAIGEKPSFVHFQSVKELSKLPRQRQRRFYRIAHDGNVSRSLRSCLRHQEMYARVRGLRQSGRTVEDTGRDLHALTQLSLGTRALEPALDNTFGNSISKLVTADIVDLWYFRLGYVLIGDFATAEKLDPLIDSFRTTPVLGRLRETPYTWIFWED